MITIIATFDAYISILTKYPIYISFFSIIIIIIIVMVTLFHFHRLCENIKSQDSHTCKITNKQFIVVNFQIRPLFTKKDICVAVVIVTLRPAFAMCTVYDDDDYDDDLSKFRFVSSEREKKRERESFLFK